MKENSCCFGNCPNRGTIFVGSNPEGNRDWEWICVEHDAYWQRIHSHRREQDAMDKAIAYLDPDWQNWKVL